MAARLSEKDNVSKGFFEKAELDALLNTKNGVRAGQGHPVKNETNVLVDVGKPFHDFRRTAARIYRLMPGTHRLFGQHR